MERIFRYAPSPTGRIHLGQLKAMLIPYVLAKKNKGKFILRIEDTDFKRNNYDAIRWLLEDMKWLGINYDYGPQNSTPNEYFQSQRLDLYKSYAEQLLKEGKCYYAYETPEERKKQIEMQRKSGLSPVYSGEHAELTPEQIKKFQEEGRKPVVRLKVPKNVEVEFTDKIFGKVSINTNQIGDIVILKSDGTPMYNFSVVVDDHTMGVTDVVRGFGHLSNTPKQILIYKSLGWKPPEFAHFSDILNEDRPGKLSKRHGAKSIHQFRTEGYLPEALINYVLVISCSFKFQNKNEEIMSLDDITEYVDYDKILHTNARFNSKKLDWFNGQHIRMLSFDEFSSRVIEWLEKYARDLELYHSSFEQKKYLITEFISNKHILLKALELVQERITKFMDIFDYLGFFFRQPEPDKIDLSCLGKNQRIIDASSDLLSCVENLSEPWTHEVWENSIRSLADKYFWNHGDMFMLLRLMIVGSKYSPPLFESMSILGKKECIARIANFINYHAAHLKN